MLVLTMYVDTAKSVQRGRTYVRHLLRQSYREKGKVKHRTIANLSHCSDEEIQAIKFALTHKHDLTSLVSVSRDVTLEQGKSVGAVWLLYQMARRLGIYQALGTTRDGKLALWQVIARIIDQGSRMSAVRLAKTHAACDVLNITESFTEDDLYANLDWLEEQREGIEDRLFRFRYEGSVPTLYLYDVTSSYLEGEKNELGAYGFNRDRKRGKKQLVIGLLCDERGVPVSVEVFPGNTRDLVTFVGQVKKLATRFGCQHVTLTGDRGMIKSAQIEALNDEVFHYITAITKPEINALVKKGVLQMDLFDQKLAEVLIREEGDKVIRYVMRRNPERVREIAERRQSKKETVQRLVDKKNVYLRTHPRAKVAVAARDVRTKINKLKIRKWLRVVSRERHLTLTTDQQALKEMSKLDGCYVLKSDLSPEVASARIIHDRYKDLALVEQAFRTFKSTFLEVRPVYVQTGDHTRAHVFVVMLAYLIVQQLREYWSGIDFTAEEGIKMLEGLNSIEMHVKGKPVCQKIPKLNAYGQQLIKAARIEMPEVVPCKGTHVATRHKLPSRRKKG